LIKGNPITCEIYTTTTSTSCTSTQTIPDEATTKEATTTEETIIVDTIPPVTSETSTQTQTTTLSHEISSGTTTAPSFQTPPITIYTRTTTESLTTTSGSPDLCDGNNLRFVPNPNYCFRFYFCMAGIAYPYKCAPDTIFSEEHQGCIDGYWDTCEPVTTTQPTTQSTTTQRPTGPPELCEETYFGFVPDTDYCFRFYFCMAGIAMSYECAPDTIFNLEKQECIEGDWDTCEPKTTTILETTTEELTTTTSEVTTTPTPGICDGYDYNFVPDPNYCFRFYFCMPGAPILYECAADTIFDERLQQCIDGDWDTCEPHNLMM
jgi:hypothetical protein